MKRGNTLLGHSRVSSLNCGTRTLLPIASRCSSCSSRRARASRCSSNSSDATSTATTSSSIATSSSSSTTSSSTTRPGWLLQALREGSLHPPAALASGLVGFAGIAAAIQPSGGQAHAAESLPLQSAAGSGEGSLLLALDQAVHEAVASSIPPAARDFWAGQVLSDSFIVLGIAGWILLSAACLWQSPRKAAAPLALSWAFYFTTAGAVGRSDPPLVFALKQLFGRARPSEHHHSLSFPSGHTSAAVFTVGALLTVLLPLALQLLSQQEQQEQERAEGNAVASGSSSNIGASSVAASASSSAGFVGAWDQPAFIYGMWAAAALTTAAGRVLADVHWVSDTLGGMALSVALVTVLGNCVRLLTTRSR